MLPKSQRYTTKDFVKIKAEKTKKLYTNIGFFVFISFMPIKFGVILSKKNFKRAVDRNKYKRLFFNTLLANKKLATTSFLFYPKVEFTKAELVKSLSEVSVNVL